MALEHYGIKGMRWGVRRKRGSDGRVKGGKTNVKKLSNEEIEARLKRIRLEREYKAATKPRSRKAVQKVSSWLGIELAKVIGKRATKDVGDKTYDFAKSYLEEAYKAARGG